MTDKPRHPVRRFDVFAEYNRIKNQADGMPEYQAKGRGIWLAKVVAGRRGMPAQTSAADRQQRERKDDKPAAEEKEEIFLSVGGEPQTDSTFDREIIDRMGRDFYDAVFKPAIEQAFGEGKRYEDIRDSIRREWK